MDLWMKRFRSNHNAGEGSWGSIVNRAKNHLFLSPAGVHKMETTEIRKGFDDWACVFNHRLSHLVLNMRKG